MGTPTVNDERRLWFDVSYTRTQSGSIGITRTVRRLFEEIKAQGAKCEPVAFHSRGFRHVSQSLSPEPKPDRPPGFADSAFRWINGPAMRRLVLLALRWVPWPLLRPAWRLASTLAFNALSQAARPVQFEPGDTLLIADASWNYPAWKAANRARAEGAKVVLLVYDLMPLRHPDFCFQLVPKLFRSWLLQMLACSDAVLCISRATEEDLRAWVVEQEVATPLPPTTHFRLGSDPAHLRCASPVRESITRFLDCQAPCFAAVGSFEPKKNYRFLIEVFDELWKRGSALRLLLVGKLTNDWPELAESLREHPELGKRMLAVHDASDAEILRIYASCHALVIPSIFEGFGLPLVEARARGCPVIASNIPAFAELADEGVDLFALNSKDHLVRLLQDHLRQGRRGRVPPMQPFTWSDSAHELLLKLANQHG